MSGRNGTANLEAERSVLGALLFHPDALGNVPDLRPRDFYSSRNQAIFQAIRDTYEASGQTDVISVQDTLERAGRLDEIGGLGELCDLLESVVHHGSVAYHAEIVREHAQRRRIGGVLRELLARHHDGAEPDELLADAQRMLRNVAESAPRRAGLQTMDLGELLKLPPTAWILDGLIPEAGIVVLAANPKTGKSLLILDVAMRMAHGIERWHERSLRPGPVLMLLGEGKRSTADRGRAWLAAHPHESLRHAIHFAHLPVLTDARGLAAVEATIAEHRPFLVVIDTLGLALGNADENDASAMGPVMSALGELRDRYGCAFVLIHHQGKSEAGRAPLARVRGSSAIGAGADAVLLLSQRERVLELSAAAVRDGEPGRPVRLTFAPIRLDDGRTGVHLVAAGDDDAASDPAKDDVDSVVAACREHGPMSSKDDIWRRADLPQGRGRAAVRKALADECIVEEGTTRNRVYRVPE